VTRTYPEQHGEVLYPDIAQAPWIPTDTQHGVKRTCPEQHGEVLYPDIVQAPLIPTDIKYKP
jgi:hypothetical protein